MTSRSYFGKMNSTLGSVVPLAMFTKEPTGSSRIVDLILLSNFLELLSTPSLEFLNVGSVIWERLQLDELLKVEILGNLLFCIH